MVSLERAFVEQPGFGILSATDVCALLQHLHDGLAGIFDSAAIIDGRDVEVSSDCQRTAFQPPENIVPAFPTALLQAHCQNLRPSDDVHDLETGKGGAEMRQGGTRTVGDDHVSRIEVTIDRGRDAIFQPMRLPGHREGALIFQPVELVHRNGIVVFTPASPLRVMTRRVK